MKTFRELISWELEQEKLAQPPVHITTEDGTKLGSCVLRKLRHLSQAAASQAQTIANVTTPAS